MQKVLITGGAGFVGSHLADLLLERGVAVVAVDDLSTGSHDNVQHLVDRPDFGFVVASIEDSDLVQGLVREADYVYHLAAAVGVRRIVDDPAQSIQTNIRGTEVILEAANRWRTPVLLTSTSEVYGKSTDFPYREDGDMVFGPTVHSRWSYAASKAIDEFLARAYHSMTGLRTVVVRLFNTVGPRQTGRYGMVIPTFVEQALAGRPITVYGDGSQRRTFTYVSDVVGAIVALSKHPEAIGEIFNIGGDREISILKLAEMIRKRTESESDIVTIPYSEAYGTGFEETPRRIPDTTRVRELIGFEPTVGLEGIIDAVAGHIRRSQNY